MRNYLFSLSSYYCLSLLYHFIVYLIGYDYSRRYKKLNYPFAEISIDNTSIWQYICHLPKSKGNSVFKVSFEIQKNAFLHWLIVSNGILVSWIVFICLLGFQPKVPFVFTASLAVDLLPILFFLSCISAQVNRIICSSFEKETISPTDLKKYISKIKREYSKKNWNISSVNIIETERRSLFKTTISVSACYCDMTRGDYIINEIATISRFRYSSKEKIDIAKQRNSI